MAEKDKEPTPVEDYQSHLEQVTANVRAMKKDHDGSIIKAYGAIAKDFEGLDKSDHKAVYKLLAKAAVAYKKGTKIPSGGEADAYEIGDIINLLKQRGMDVEEVVKKFQNGEGEDVLKKLMESYHQKNISNKHSHWFLEKVGRDYAKRSKLAKGYKIHHNASEHEAAIAEDLEQKVLQQAYQNATQ